MLQVIEKRKKYHQETNNTYLKEFTDNTDNTDSKEETYNGMLFFTFFFRIKWVKSCITDLGESWIHFRGSVFYAKNCFKQVFATYIP